MLFWNLLDGSLASSAGVNLCFDDDDFTAQFRVRCDSFLGRPGNPIFEDGNTRFGEHLFRLEFMDLHLPCFL
jgi:hypothetical protein